MMVDADAVEKVWVVDAMGSCCTCTALLWVSMCRFGVGVGVALAPDAKLDEKKVGKRRKKKKEKKKISSRKKLCSQTLSSNLL